MKLLELDMKKGSAPVLKFTAGVARFYCGFIPVNLETNQARMAQP